MATWVWILIAIAVVVVIALVVLGTVRRRTSMLRQRFGPEYDRTVEAREDKRAAEGELRARERQRAQLTIKPLPEATRLRFAKEWRDVQERFVDQPSQAVAEADTLITRVMEERGYPTTQFEAQADVVSVDHPDVVENYRFGHAVWQRSQSREISTEELREALLRYRSLFDELLQPDTAQTAATGADEPGAALQAASPPEDETGGGAAQSTEDAAPPTADAAAGEPRDPAYQDQTARGGRP
jgi:hypothetical protein